VARHGLAWYEVDLNWYGISALRMVGLAWDISLPKLGREKAINPVTVPESPAVLVPSAPEVVPQEAVGD
jgi:hypothetical protein